MATLTLDDIPQELVEQLEKDARRNRRSVAQEILTRLTASPLRPRRRIDEETLESLRRFRESLSYMEPLTDELIDQAKREGRP